MAASAGPDIVEDGLVLYLDAGNLDGFPGGEPTTNLLTNRLDLTTGWNYRNMSVSPTDDGFFRATETTTNDAHIVRQVFTTEANTVYTFSTKVKKLGRRYIGLSFTYYTNWTGGAGGHTYFDLDTVSVIGSLNSGPLDLGIEDIGNQTFLLWITALSTNIVTSATNLFTYADLNFTTFVGDPNLGFLTKEFQLEKKMYPTPFVDGTRNNWKDLSGNGNNGTLVNGADYNSTIAKNITFDGINDHVTLGDVSDFNFTEGIFSVSAWVLIPSSWTGGSQYPNLVSKGAQAGWDTDGWAMYVFRNRSSGTGYAIGFGSRNGSQLNTRPEVGNLPTDVPIHATITAGGIGSFMRVYINGEVRSSKTQTISLPVTNAPLLIGRDNVSSYFPGKVYSVQIFNRALSTEEILQNYNATKSRFYDI